MPSSYLLLLLMALFWAPRDGTIAGRVFDIAGKPIAGAEVRITESLTGGTRTVRSGNDGLFESPPLPAGSYDLEIVKNGYGRFLRTRIPVTAGERQFLDCELPAR